MAEGGAVEGPIPGATTPDGAAAPVAPAAPAGPAPSEPFQDASARRVRWFRRRPPAEFDRFARGVWWCGQVQLFLAIASLPLGLLLILWGVVGASPASATGAVFIGTTLVALPGPIALSGLMLRGTARRLDSLSGGRRWIALVGWVLLIALVATVAAIAAVFLVVFAFVVVSGMASGSF